MKQLINENWNLENLYPGGKNSEKLISLINSLPQQINNLNEQIDGLNLADHSISTSNLLHIIDELQYLTNAILEIDDYLICLASDKSDDIEAANLLAHSSKLKSQFETVQRAFDQLLKALSQKTWATLIEHEQVQPYQFYLKERRQRSTDKLSLSHEKIINSLAVDGFTGWEHHYDQLMSNFKVKVDDKVVSINDALFQAGFSSDHYHRRQAAHGLEEACYKHENTFVSILNHIAGFRLETYKQRGWTNLLKESLDQNRIQQATLNALLKARNENKSLIESFLKRKTELAGIKQVGWYDLLAPSFSSKEHISYKEARRIIIEQFYEFSKKLGMFAERAFNEGWIEVEDRENKSYGAFCASLPLSKESRIFLTFKGNYQDVVTLAHELGHAYHNYILHEEPAFAQQKGTSLAETASTFMENLVLDATIKQAPTDKEKLALLELKITNGLKYIGLIPSMFEFEQKFYEKRKHGLVTAEEINGLMEDTENALYGNVVDQVDKHRWMTIPHFYSTETPFYNIPYTIGFLLSNRIYAAAQLHGKDFVSTYDKLLRHSGKMTVEQLAESFLDEDLRHKGFWQSSIEPITEAINEYISITNKLL
ncbi:M3 family oligoendopeptidase [Halobacillus seohaensis]|uniref:M3 family oligoendopeptidase n=1 Tax=Halobacillus seohaensis TaxID=447421 RepID=A0ABW2EKI0_9BACI